MVGVRPARRDIAGVRPEAVLDQSLAALAVHVHEHVEAGKAMGETQVALVVLDREHEAADRVPVGA
jgi:hypothetical protein